MYIYLYVCITGPNRLNKFWGNPWVPGEQHRLNKNSTFLFLKKSNLKKKISWATPGTSANITYFYIIIIVIYVYFTGVFTMWARLADRIRGLLITNTDGFKMMMQQRFWTGNIRLQERLLDIILVRKYTIQYRVYLGRSDRFHTV